jgi:hypothetical protein
MQPPVLHAKFAENAITALSVPALAPASDTSVLELPAVVAVVTDVAAVAVSPPWPRKREGKLTKYACWPNRGRYPIIRNGPDRVSDSKMYVS